MLVLSLKLVLAHLMGDFLLQPDQWVNHKKEKREKSKYLYWHITVHALLLVLVLQFDLSYWFGILSLIVSHYVIDLLKLYLNRKVNSQLLFFADQILHFAVIAGVVCYYYPFQLSLGILYSPASLLLITAVLLTTYVTSIVMKVLLSTWRIKSKKTNRAGKYIGMLERLFIFFFILLDYWEGIGFLIAAKSVFRFGDLSKAKDRGLTEYILIGTLLSFGLAMAIALGYNYIYEMIGQQ
ncbi:DUF3307 domain-containing protein [uncultured Croceitalea sp.]|uniref:DUF3307 domain-containing protein n=1 Tax=uncultured Croceitalea sp. TaxID=1798908 RepID=UPI00330600D4